jgi:hypothetical protein
LAQVVPATALKIDTETMAVHRDLIPVLSPGRLAAAVEALLPAGIVVIGQWDLRVAPVVVRLKKTAPPWEELSSRPTTAGLSRFGDIRADSRPAPMAPKRVLVVEVLVALEKTRSIKQEVGQAARESVSTWVAEPSTLLVEVQVPLSTVLAAWEVPPVG